MTSLFDYYNSPELSNLWYTLKDLCKWFITYKFWWFDFIVKNIIQEMLLKNTLQEC